MQQDLTKILNFTHEMRRVKNLLRFKGMPMWEGENIERWDSVAEHSYRMALLAVMVAPYLEKKVSLEKVLKIILVHDIVEILAFDYSPISSHGEGGGHAFDKKAFQEKYEREMVAAKSIFKDLPGDLSQGFLGLFMDYINTKINTENASPEGRLAYALDKIEANIQIIDWKKESKNWNKENFEKSIEYMHIWSDYEPSLKHLADLVEKEGRELVE